MFFSTDPDTVRAVSAGDLINAQDIPQRMRQLRTEISFALSDMARGGPDRKPQIAQWQEELRELDARREAMKAGGDA